MPTYAFSCPVCGQQAEVMRPLADYDQPLLCDGTQLDPEPQPHEPVKMDRVISNFMPIVRNGTRNIKGR